MKAQHFLDTPAYNRARDKFVSHLRDKGITTISLDSITIGFKFSSGDVVNQEVFKGSPDDVRKVSVAYESVIAIADNLRDAFAKTIEDENE